MSQQMDLIAQHHTKAGVVERPSLRPLSKADQRGGSHEAAERIVASGMHASRCHIVLKVIVEQWRLNERAVLTAGEIANDLGVARNEIAKRVADLNAAGWIASAGRRTCAVSGIACLQWEPTPMGLRGYDLGLPIPKPEKARARDSA